MHLTNSHPEQILAVDDSCSDCHNDGDLVAVPKKGTVWCYEKDPCNACEGEFMWVAKDLDTGEGADYRYI